jgi:hypothetical protein
VFNCNLLGRWHLTFNPNSKRTTSNVKISRRLLPVGAGSFYMLVRFKSSVFSPPIIIVVMSRHSWQTAESDDEDPRSTVRLQNKFWIMDAWKWKWNTVVSFNFLGINFEDKQTVRCSLIFEFMVLILAHSMSCNISFSWCAKFHGFMIQTKISKFDIQRAKCIHSYNIVLTILLRFYQLTFHSCNLVNVC